MKESLRGFLAALAIIVSAVCAWGEGSPVVVTHNLTGYSKGDNAVTLEYAVQVQNREDAPLGPLSLSLVPRPHLVTTKPTITIDHLAPNGRAEVTVKVVTRQLLDERYFSHKPLLWAGKYTNANGKVIEFPATSKPGGAK